MAPNKRAKNKEKLVPLSPTDPKLWNEEYKRSSQLPLSVENEVLYYLKYCHKKQIPGLPSSLKSLYNSVAEFPGQQGGGLRSRIERFVENAVRREDKSAVQAIQHKDAPILFRNFGSITTKMSDESSYKSSSSASSEDSVDDITFRRMEQTQAHTTRGTAGRRTGGSYSPPRRKVAPTPRKGGSLSPNRSTGSRRSPGRRSPTNIPSTPDISLLTDMLGQIDFEEMDPSTHSAIYEAIQKTNHVFALDPNDPIGMPHGVICVEVPDSPNASGTKTFTKLATCIQLDDFDSVACTKAYLNPNGNAIYFHSPINCRANFENRLNIAGAIAENAGNTVDSKLEDKIVGSYGATAHEAKSSGLEFVEQKDYDTPLPIRQRVFLLPPHTVCTNKAFNEPQHGQTEHPINPQDLRIRFAAVVPEVEGLINVDTFRRSFGIEDYSYYDEEEQAVDVQIGNEISSRYHEYRTSAKIDGDGFLEIGQELWDALTKSVSQSIDESFVFAIIQLAVKNSEKDINVPTNKKAQNDDLVVDLLANAKISSGRKFPARRR